MRICPRCRTTYTEKTRKVCPKDGTRLVDAREQALADADPLLGQRVAGRFTIHERIGVGGMGTVYRAEQSGLGRPVALKILKKELVWDRDTVQRFHREAKAMSLLVHSNTVRVFDFGETEEGLLYLAMELLEGELITTKLDREGALDVKEAVDLIRQMLRSLAEAHSKGIIHRDLKPDNIFLARVDGHAAPVLKVLDFGIAKVIQGDRKIDQLETQAGTVFGTPRYMSPEQAQGKKLDVRSDLYSVGILLYQLLTGRPPFVDDDAVVVMAKHIKERPDSPRTAAPDRPIPPSLDRLVMKSIEKDPARRPSTAEEFEGKLALALPDIDAEIALRKGPSRPGLATLLRGAPRGALAVGGVTIAAAVGLGIYLASASGAQRPRSEPLVYVPPATPVAPSAPAPGAPLASVLLQSTPEGAEVWANGVALGTTPLAVPIPMGMDSVEVELRREGYGSATTQLLRAVPTLTVPLLQSAASPADPGAARGKRPPIRRPPIAQGSRDPGTASPPAAPAAPPTPEPRRDPPRRDPYERFE